jgi:hypothetical protein
MRMALRHSTSFNAKCRALRDYFKRRTKWLGKSTAEHAVGGTPADGLAAAAPRLATRVGGNRLVRVTPLTRRRRARAGAQTARPTNEWHPRGRNSRREAGDYRVRERSRAPRRRWPVYSITITPPSLVDSTRWESELTKTLGMPAPAASH